MDQPKLIYEYDLHNFPDHLLSWELKYTMTYTLFAPKLYPFRPGLFSRSPGRGGGGGGREGLRGPECKESRLSRLSTH